MERLLTPEIQQKVQEYLNKLLKGSEVLEIGSYNVNGGVKEYFEGWEYLGTDMRHGPGVDLVLNSHDALGYFGEERFDVVLWLEAAEHDDAFWTTMRGIRKMVKKGGFVVMSAPYIGFPYHEYPHDYWRFTEDAFRLMLSGWAVHDLVVLGGPTLIACAQKPV